MTFTKIVSSLSTFSFALALMGGALVFSPSSADAAGFISNGALKKNNIPCSIRSGNQGNCRVGPPVNKWTRPCTAQQRCRG